jgi:hypothetical protein
MIQEDDDMRMLGAMKAAMQRSRGHADFFGWYLD